MGQTLTNGIYLPNEGERNCYSGLAANWNAVDTLKGNYSLHAINVDIHVTAADKQAWNGKADASALTAHTGDTTIHVTAADKQAWDGHVADSVKHVTAEDKAAWNGKADDSDVVHKSGDETISGQKTLVNLLPLKGEFLGTEASNNGRSLLYFLANRDTQNQSGIFLTKFRQNKAQGGMSGNDIAYLSFDCLENSVRTNNGLRINFLNFVNDIPQRFILWSGITEKLLGVASAPWSDVSTDKINGLNPSSLGMPNLGNGIDISGYITHLDKVVNNYTPPANGWLSVRVKKTSLSHTSLMLYQTGGLLSSCEADEYNISGTNLPVTANQNVEIYIYADALVDAKFYPCQGNV